MVYIYARKSLERKDSTSIQTQIDQCMAFVTGNHQVFSDSGYSGGNTKRPGFEKMLKGIKAGGVEAVISYRLDRISRNISDFANLMRFFEAHGVKYVSATEQLDTSTPGGRAMMYIASVFAQLERETIAERILDNYRFRANRGVFMGGNAPFGYDVIRVDIDGKKMPVLTPGERADDLRRIFNMFLSGQPLTNMAKVLNGSGVLSTKGNFWTPSTLKRVLRNISPCCADENLYSYLVKKGYQVPNPIEHYTGTHGMCLFFKQKDRNKANDIAEQIAVVGFHDPLIPSEQFISAQRLLDRNQEAAPGKRSSRTFLAGIVKCASCGHSVGIKVTQKKTRSGIADYAYYFCRSRYSRGICDNKTFFPADELEQKVLLSCREYIDEISVRAITTKQDVKRGLGEAAKIQAQIDNLINNIGNGNAVVDRLLTDRITKLQEALNKTAAAVHDDAPSIDIEWARELLGRFDGLDIQEKASCIRQLVNSITVDSRYNINIEFAI